MKVRAYIHPDERTDLAAEFDAAPFIDCQEDGFIQALMRNNYGYCDEADDIGWWAENRDVNAARVFTMIAGYNAIASSREQIGFGCFVDSDDFSAWIKANRPHLAAE